MTDAIHQVAVALPLHSADRAKLRELIPGYSLPAIYPNSIARPCTRCGMTLAVGPRITAALEADPTLRLFCPLCLAWVSGPDPEYHSLGNPESKFEDA